MGSHLSMSMTENSGVQSYLTRFRCITITAAQTVFHDKREIPIEIIQSMERLEKEVAYLSYSRWPPTNSCDDFSI